MHAVLHVKRKRHQVHNLVNERRQEGQEKVSYPEICEPKPCQSDRAVKAAATKKANKEKQIAMANDVENQLLLNNDAIMSASDQELGVLMKAWHLATCTKFSNGYYITGLVRGRVASQKEQGARGVC